MSSSDPPLTENPLIYTDNPGGLPATYELPGTFDLTLQSIVARIDGSGAAGDFLPSLAIYSQNGLLMARVPSDVTYSPGDTGVVTWSPFLARRVASSAVTNLAPGAAQYGPAPSVTVSGALFDLSGSFSSTYQIGAGTYIAPSGGGHVQVKTTIPITATVFVQWAAPFAGVRYLQLEWTGGAGDQVIPSVGQLFRGDESASGTYEVLTVTGFVVLNTGPIDFIAKVFQASGANQTTAWQGLSVVGHNVNTTP